MLLDRVKKLNTELDKTTNVSILHLPSLEHEQAENMENMENMGDHSWFAHLLSIVHTNKHLEPYTPTNIDT